MEYLTGNTTIGTSGVYSLRYDTDSSPYYINRSLVDAAYVTGITSCGITIANNGLTKNGKTVSLGGSLTGDTTIDIGANIFNLCSSDCNVYFTVQGGAGATDKISMYSTSGITIHSNDQVYIRSANSECLILGPNANPYSVLYSTCGLLYGGDYSSYYKCLSIPNVGWVTGCTSSISGNYICAANNGLTKSGNNVSWGGTLIGNTCIDGGYAISFGSVTPISDFDVCSTGDIAFNSNTTFFASAVKASIGVPNIGQLNLSTTGASNTFIDFRSGAAAVGLVYGSNYSANFVDRSLVDKGYVNSVVQKNNIYAMNVLTTSTLLTTGDTYVQIVNSPSAAVTITLPADPIDGQVFRIKDAGNQAITYPITVARNGKLIDNATNNASINTDGGALELVYNNSLGSWFVFSFVN